MSRLTAEDTKAPPARAEAGAPLGRVLLVDDDATFSLEVAAALSGSGWTLEAADDPEQLLDDGANARPHVLIVDVRMPRMDGDQLLSALDADSRLDGVRVFATSSVHPPPSIWRRFAPFRATFLAKHLATERTSLLAALGSPDDRVS